MQSSLRDSVVLARDPALKRRAIVRRPSGTENLIGARDGAFDSHPNVAKNATLGWDTPRWFWYEQKPVQMESPTSRKNREKWGTLFYKVVSFVYSVLILARNSLFVVAFARRSISSSMASTGDNGLRTFLRTQMRCRS